MRPWMLSVVSSALPGYMARTTVHRVSADRFMSIFSFFSWRNTPWKYLLWTARVILWVVTSPWSLLHSTMCERKQSSSSYIFRRLSTSCSAALYCTSRWAGLGPDPNPSVQVLYLTL